jgi:hypothetical protein
MRALHAFLTAVSPLVILSACDGPKNDLPPPKTDSPPSPVDSPSAQLYPDGSRIISMRLRLRDGREVDVKNLPDSTDAVFTSASVLDSILIPYYERKKTEEDKATADSLRRSRGSVGNPRAYAAHRLTSRSSVESIE